jgi:hypothetical protein
MPRLKPIQTLPDEPLELPLMTSDGTFHLYRVQPATGEAWFRFSALGQAFEDASGGRAINSGDQVAVDEITKLGVVGLHAATLGGDVVAAMLADGVSAADIRRAHQTALVWHVSGGNTERAEAAWELGEATPESTSTTTAPASSTPLRKRSSSTTSPTTSSPSSEVRSA